MPGYDQKPVDLDRIEGLFAVSKPAIKKFVNNFHDEMAKGLKGAKSCLQMIPTYVSKSTGKEKGRFLALDLGGSNFRVLGLELRGRGRIHSPVVSRYSLKDKHVMGPGKELFNFIARCIKDFLVKFKTSSQGAVNVGFTFSFPVKQNGIASGSLVKWTKGFKASGVEGKDVVKLLNQSLLRMKVKNTQVVALANDTVGTLASKSYSDPDCDIGVILGTGTNACYVEEISKIKKWPQHKKAKGQMIINIEWGNFNKVPLTAYDKELNSFSENPGEQILEKMVSGMYLGEIARLIIMDLIMARQILDENALFFFAKPYHFKSEHMSLIESDKEGSFPKVNGLFKDLGITSASLEDMKLLRRVCAIVSTRAARLSACAIAAVITKIDPSLSRKHTIAIDGSVYEKYFKFSDRIYGALEEYFGPKIKNIKISLAKDGSGIGAAVIAAVAISK